MHSNLLGWPKKFHLLLCKNLNEFFLANPIIKVVWYVVSLISFFHKIYFKILNTFLKYKSDYVIVLFKMLQQLHITSEDPNSQHGPHDHASFSSWIPCHVSWGACSCSRLQAVSGAGMVMPLSSPDPFYAYFSVNTSL